MTVLIAAVVGGFLVIIIAIIGVFCFFRKVHKNSTPGNTPVNSRPTSQQEQAEMTSVRVLMILVKVLSVDRFTLVNVGVF